MSVQSWESPLSWEPLSDFELDEWLLFKDEFEEKKVSGPTLKLGEYETPLEILFDTQKLQTKENDYWLDEFPLFEEIPTLSPLNIVKPQNEEISQDFMVNLTQEQASVDEKNQVISDRQQELPVIIEIPATSSDDSSATFSLSNEIDFYVDAEQFINVSSLQSECSKSSESLSEESLGETSSSGQSSPDPTWTPDTALETKRRDWEKSKPYRRGGSQKDKKLRKKEQNKNAATRYRLKKKAEAFEIIQEELKLKEEKTELENKVRDIEHEIKCLKGLMRDLFRAKGLIN